MTQLFGSFGCIKPTKSSPLKLGLILIIFMSLFARANTEASPVPSSPRRHPPHNGSMFGKRSVIMPLVDWQSKTVQEQLSGRPPSITPQNADYDYEWKTYRRLSKIIGKAIDECSSELGQLGETNIIEMEAICVDFFANQIMRKSEERGAKRSLTRLLLGI